MTNVTNDEMTNARNNEFTIGRMDGWRIIGMTNDGQTMGKKMTNGRLTNATKYEKAMTKDTWSNQRCRCMRREHQTRQDNNHRQTQLELILRVASWTTCRCTQWPQVLAVKRSVARLATPHAKTTCAFELYCRQQLLPDPSPGANCQVQNCKQKVRQTADAAARRILFRYAPLVTQRQSLIVLGTLRMQDCHSQFLVLGSCNTYSVSVSLVTATI